MKDFFQELLEYTHHYNVKFIELLLAHPDEASEKIQKLMSHTLNAHGNWNARILLKPAPNHPWDLHSNEALLPMEDANFKTSLDIVENRDFDEVIPFVLGTGQAMENTVRNILFQAINHATYHRAQMNTEWKLNGVAPLVTDYIFFKR